MSALAGQFADYLAVRRALGYRLERQEKLLGQFLDYLEDRGLEQITIEHALRWATLPAGAPRWHANRLCAVRGFARHLEAIGVPVEVPASGLLPSPSSRAVPYLYSDEQIAALMDAAGTPVDAASRSDLPHADRAAGGHRDASRGGGRA